MQLRRRELLTRTLVGGAALLTLNVCGGGDGDRLTNDVQAALRKLDELGPDWLKRTGVPGMAVAVVFCGQTIYAKGFGVRRVDRPALVDADTVFQLASVSKSVSSTVMTTQMPGGGFAGGRPSVDWNTPIAQLMPDFKLAYADPAMNAKLTLGDLYAHRSGLPDHAGDQLEDIGYGRAEILQRLRDVAMGRFGDYEYTNFGLTAAAQAMADARGVDWATLCQQSIYGPLGMSSTSSRYADYTARANRAWNHVQKDVTYDTYGALPGVYVVADPERDADAQAPAGGVSSSVNDMARWLTLMLAGGKWQGQQLLGPDALKAATTAQPGGKYGYGFNVGPDPMGHFMLSHSGAFLTGAATSFSIWPEDDLAIVVLTNAQPRGLPEALGAAFDEAALGGGSSTTDWLLNLQNLDAFHGLYTPLGRLAGQVPPADAAPPRMPISNYLGTYTNAYYGPAQIAFAPDGKTLELIMGPAAVHYPLYHWNGDLFAFNVHDEDAPAGTISGLEFRLQSLQIDYFSQDLARGVFVRS